MSLQTKMSVGEAAAIMVSRIIPEEMLEGVDGQQEAAEAEGAPDAEDAAGPDDRVTPATPPTTPDEDDEELVHGVDTPMSPEPVAGLANGKAENI